MRTSAFVEKTYFFYKLLYLYINTVLRGQKMSDMLSYEAVQLKKLLAEEKDIRNRYISAAEEISDPQLKEKLQKCAAVHGSHISVINGLTGEKND